MAGDNVHRFLKDMLGDAGKMAEFRSNRDTVIDGSNLSDDEKALLKRSNPREVRDHLADEHHDDLFKFMICC